MKIETSTQDRKGSAIKTNDTLGYIKIMPISKEKHPFIAIDCFDGYGESYKELPEPEIRIYDANVELIFKGNFRQLAQLIIDAKNMAEGIHADLEAGNIPDDLHELDIELYRNFANKYK